MGSRHLHGGEVDADVCAAVSLRGVGRPCRGKLEQHEEGSLDVGHARAQALSAEEAADGKAEVLQIPKQHEDVESAHCRPQKLECVPM